MRLILKGLPLSHSFLVKTEDIVDVQTKFRRYIQGLCEEKPLRENTTTEIYKNSSNTGIFFFHDFQVILGTQQHFESRHRYIDKKRKDSIEKKTYRSSRPQVFCKKVFLEISQNSQENTCARVSFLIKLQASGLQLY